MGNFYHHFLLKCAQILKPLTDLLKGGAKTLEWTVSAQEAFQNAKRLLAACNKNQEAIGDHLVSFPSN
jgi:hypothetical protein